MTQTGALIAKTVSRLYAGKAVVADANLILEPGQITALLGKSGAGKSTLLRLLAGLERPDKGEIRLGETCLSSATHMVPAEKRRIGLIFQDFALFPHLTASENIMFGLADHSKAKAQTHAQEWLERVGLGNRGGAYPHQLSGGEQQRIAIARALAPQPIAILMDEPFSGLDPALREDVRLTALEAIRASKTPALLVTHDASEAMLCADQLAVMRGGRIVQQGSPETVYTQPVDKETATALGHIILLEGQIKADLETVETPFGSFSRPGLKTARKVIIGVRPESVLLDKASPIKAEILSARRNGPMRQLQIECGEMSTAILVPASHHVSQGDIIGIKLAPDSCIIF